MQRAIPLNKIKPNPFRNMDRYPIQRDKIEALKESFRKTGFWGNIVARESDGHVEIAYGHHRLVALREDSKSKTAKVDVIIKKLGDDTMVRMMADENMQEWGTSAAVEQETIRAVVEAYAAGKIELPKVKNPDRGGGLRNAPGFRQATFKTIKSWGQPLKPYNAESIARFLGWMSGDQVSPRVRNALAALEAAEEMDLDSREFDGLTSEQAKVATETSRTVERSYDLAASAMKNPARQKAHREKGRKRAKTALKTTARRLRKGDLTIRQARQQADLYRDTTAKEIPDIEVYAERLVKQINALLGKDDERVGKLQEVIKYQEHLSDKGRRYLLVALDKLSQRCRAFSERLGSSPKRLT